MTNTVTVLATLLVMISNAPTAAGLTELPRGPRLFGHWALRCSTRGLARLGFSGSLRRGIEVTFRGTITSGKREYLIFYRDFINAKKAATAIIASSFSAQTADIMDHATSKMNQHALKSQCVL